MQGTQQILSKLSSSDWIKVGGEGFSTDYAATLGQMLSVSSLMTLRYLPAPSPDKETKGHLLCSLFIDSVPDAEQILHISS